MKAQIKVLIVALLALPVMTIFQNCAPSESAFDSLDNARLVAKADNTALGELEEKLVDVPATTDDDAALVYTCVLDGPGTSVRLHLEQGLLSGKSTIDAVCLSKHACLDLVSERFAVKEAKLTGYCGKNKHAVSLDDSQITELLK